MKHKVLIFTCCALLSAAAQSQTVKLIRDDAGKKVDILVGGKPFTSFIYPDHLEKPVLYPIRAANGTFVTRGFPIVPRDGERNDHPHHIGLWLNYESVNGLDFWNNSYAIPAANKARYGWIRKVRVVKVTDGKQGRLDYSASWENQAGKALLIEDTYFIFSGKGNSRTIDRVTTLTAQKDSVFFKDIKDGMLGLRVTKELEMPSDKVEEFVDSQGNVTKVSASGNGANGNYLTSTGKRGNDAWGTRGTWCLLAAKKEGVPLSVAMIDYPKNPGYPTYWHARDYGLFAANPLGQAIFSNGKEKLDLKLAPGQSVTFKYRILVTSGAEVTAEQLDRQAAEFGKQ